ncbi:protein HID1-like protein [Dinothrombium tinctorium]|uniref:Protein HID1-like protein n=1 Tax=Dinothrombium tinctorium TaxID=1965070 RepID=A0A3S3QPA6_9ACAR|nr:protein HID1-like protein [Dinothrombium tinctorium]RWS11877.1 protein HID1-like protein [Dinothrombium tinctorium]RWS11881.1 protein HID1-like protein [Dinothrombium tinctorium]
MGNADTKLNFRKAIVQLTTKTQPIDAKDDHFWDQFWCESVNSIQDVFALIPAPEIRALREESPSNLATLVYKAVEKLVHSTDTLCNTASQQLIVLNSTRILTRILPYIFEDPDWKGFFWSSLPSGSNATDQAYGGEESETHDNLPLAQSLILAVCDLLFCPDFVVAPLPSARGKFGSPDSPPEDLQSIDSCEYIWEPGVGFTNSTTSSSQFDRNRTELLRLLLTCFSTTMYMTPNEAGHTPNKWIQFFTSNENRHALPLFTSFINTVFSYDPTGYIPFNHLIFNDTREQLVEVCVQILIVTLDHDFSSSSEACSDPTLHDNLFINYLSRIHREEDLSFILKGFTRLLNNPLLQTYIPNSTKKIQFHQELLVLFWKVCDYNKKFMYYVLKSSDVLDILTPILYHLNDSRSDQSRIGLIHIGVFILLLLSGERNFGVRLNKPYSANVPMDVPIFTGTHADLLIIVFHKLITTGHQRLQPLFDCLLTIIVNVSPYLKTLSMVASTKLLHLLEAFSTPWFLYSSPTNHHLVFFLLEVFNNIIQYQFDGNSNLVYQIIRKRNVFNNLSNLPTDYCTIQKSLNRQPTKRPKSLKMSTSMSVSTLTSPSSPGISSISEPSTPTSAITPKKEQVTEENSEQSNINVSLAATPRVDKMTEKTHPNPAADPDGNNTERVLKDKSLSRQSSSSSSTSTPWQPTSEWVMSWKQKLPLQTIMRMLQVLVPQVEKMCIDKGITDENEILKFLQHGTLVGLLPVPHPILIRKYQTNAGTTLWFRTYMWGVIYLRNIDPPICVFNRVNRCKTVAKVEDDHKSKRLFRLEV